MKLSNVPATPNENDPFYEINRLFRCYQKGILSELETMVCIAATASEAVRLHMIESRQEESA